MENQMAYKGTWASPNTLARIAAVLFLIIFAMGITVELFLLGDILVPGDAAATVTSLVASEALFRATVFGYLIRQVFLALLALVTYKLFKSVDGNAAGLMITFALLGSAISMVNELNYFAALQLAVGADTFAALGAAQVPDLVAFFLKMHDYGAAIASTFSLWIALLGYLALKSRFFPRAIGLLMMIGGIVWTTLAIPLVSPSFDPTYFGLFAFASEVVFYLWLLIRGVKTTQYVRTTKGKQDD
jgi:hypothetical protein